MKTQLDALMAQRGLSALIVSGEGYSDVRDYLVNGADVGHGVVVKPQGAEPVLFVGGMELDSAKKSGLACYTFAEVGYYDLLKQNDDLLWVKAQLWRAMLQKVGVQGGKVGIYGRDKLETFISFYQRLVQSVPEYEFVGEELKTTLFEEAYLTKGADELERIQRVARLTNEVLQATWDFITGHLADAEGKLHDSAGASLTVGMVKGFVRKSLLERGLEDTGMIFAQGRDAGYPHSRGEDDDVLQTGKSIVFDLFPRELGGGYHHDVTRTWCIGYAPPEVQRAYEQVMEAFDKSIEAYGVGKQTHLLQEVVLDSFEAQGHPTLRTDTKTLKGYVHSLGHGVGLNIHERPSITHLRQDDSFQVGNLITIEPGLYYPEEGYGVRIEDTLYINENGELLSLTPFKKDLVLPLKGQA